MTPLGAVTTVLPFCAAIALAAMRPGRLVGLGETAATLAVCLLAGVLLIRTPALPAYFALLAAVIAALTAFATPSETRLRAVRRQVLLGGSILLFLADDLLVSWLGLLIASAATAIQTSTHPAATHRSARAACLGVMLALCGTVLLCVAAAPLGIPTHWCALAAAQEHMNSRLTGCGFAVLVTGCGVLALRMPALTNPVLFMFMRVFMLLGDTAVHAAARHLVDALILAVMLVAAAPTRASVSPRRRIGQARIVHAGAAAYAFAQGGEAATLAGVLQLTLLGLTLCAVRTRGAGDHGLTDGIARAGLAGIPPFGTFASLALIAKATLDTDPWLLVPFAAALAMNAWNLLAGMPRTPAARDSSTIAPAWTAIVLCVLLGVFLPGPASAWIARFVSAGR